MDIVDQKYYLKKIIESDSFKKAPASIALLEFLANSTFDKKDLKETTIALELFGNNFISENNSSRIRVNIYHLRKRLTAYYEHEGKQDSFRLEIKKGQYNISFKKNNELKEVDYRKRYKIVLMLLSIVGIIFITIIIRLFYKESTVLWDSFFNSEKETLLVVGDLFGVEGKNFEGKTCWYRDYRINSAEELYAYKRKNPIFKDSIKASSYTYMTGMGAVSANDLSRMFTKRDREITIKLSSKIGFRDIKHQNIVYVGPLKNKNKLIDYFNQAILDYQLLFGEGGVILHDVGKDKDYKLSTKTNNIEYAMVAKLYNKSNGNSQFMFFSDHDIGAMATVDYFTSNKQLKIFADKYGVDEKKSFIALFKVQGRERTNLGLELVIVEVGLQMSPTF